jgi:hypothetical protein
MRDETHAGDAPRESVSRDHRRLDDLLGEVAATFAERRDDPDALRDAFAALCEQIDVHFEQEDRLYYAPIGALRPELEPEIRAILEAHRGFRLEIAAIGDRLECEDVAAALRQLVAFGEGFRRHEAMEEALLARVEAES